MDIFLHIHGQHILLDEIEKFQSSTSFEEATQRFIREWQSGKDSFTIQTSGSTGKPKPITISREQMETSASFTIEALSLRAGYNALVCLDTRYIAGKMMLVRAMTGRMNMIIQNPSSNPLKDIDIQPHFAALVPLQLQEILTDKASAAKLNAMHAIIVGGAPVSPTLRAQIEELIVPVYATYGMTETVSHIALKKLNGPDRSEYYHAFPEVNLGLDLRGCLTIQSVLTGHKKITTNDRVILRNPHQFEWLGRIDNVINSGGVKVQSEKIENIAEKFFAELNITNRFFITGIADQKLGQSVTLVVESALPLAQERTLIESLQSKLGKFEMPRQILYFSAFKETPTGKVNRKATLEQKSN